MLGAISAVNPQEINRIETGRSSQSRRSASKEIISSSGAPDKSIKPEEASRIVSERVVRDLDRYVKSMQRDMDIQVHEGTGKIIVKIISKESGEVIREVPPEEILNLAARMKQMSGALLDRNA